MASAPDRPASPFPAILGGVLAAVALLWVVKAVVGVVAALVRLGVIAVVVTAAVYLWYQFKNRE